MFSFPTSWGNDDRAIAYVLCAACDRLLALDEHEEIELAIETRITAPDVVVLAEVTE